MDQIKVLVVDDSSLMRKLISKMVNSDPEIKVVDTAINGLFALKKIEKFNPDVILLDIEMPEMNGIQFLGACKKLAIDIPIIVLSSVGGKRSEITLQCLSLGAKDFIIKPSGPISLDIATVEKEVTSKIKFFYREHPKHHVNKKELKEAIDNLRHKSNIPTDTSSPTSDIKILSNKSIEKNEINTQNKILTKEPTIRQKLENISSLDILAIGISTGGPHALRKILPLFPASYSLPIVIVQHMPPGFTREFAKGLDEICQLNVKEAVDGDEVKVGTVYIAAGDFHLSVEEKGRTKVTALSDSPPVNGHRPSVEVLFNSISKIYGAHSINIIMTGMGKDGAEAINLLSDKGGISIAQSEKSCVVYGMPKVAIALGRIDEVLDLDDIPTRILEITNTFI